MVHAAEKLLDDFRKLPGRVARPRTFMEIAGYPHYENVCSNILAFFMDPQESHGLGTLVLDALVSAGGIDASEGSISSSVSVDREVTTQAGNRIDLLITSDDHAILIENKIYATVNNPFADYTSYLDLNHGDLVGHKILLTVFPTSEGHEWGFANLTYTDLVGEIRSLLGRYVSSADTRHLTIFLDFLNTLENLQRGTRMDRELIEFLADRNDDVHDLLAKVKGFKDELRSKIQELQNLVDVSKYRNIEREGLWRTGTLLVDILYYDIRVSENLLVAFEPAVNPHGWQIEIWPRKGDRSELRNLLRDLKIQFEERPENMKCFISPVRFAYDEDLKRIRPVVQELVDKLATSQEREE